jgi:hypothetical protein
MAAISMLDRYGRSWIRVHGLRYALRPGTSDHEHIVGKILDRDSDRRCRLNAAALCRHLVRAWCWSPLRAVHGGERLGPVELALADLVR